MENRKISHVEVSVEIEVPVPEAARRTGIVAAKSIRPRPNSAFLFAFAKRHVVIVRADFPMAARPIRSKLASFFQTSCIATFKIPVGTKLIALLREKYRALAPDLVTTDTSVACAHGTETTGTGMDPAPVFLASVGFDIVDTSAETAACAGTIVSQHSEPKVH